MGGREVYVAGIGSYSPGDPVPFDRIEDVLGKIEDAPKKILRRIERMRPVMKDMLGIEYSHYALDPKTREPTETNVSMSVKSAKKAFEMARMEPPQIDLLVYAGVVYDYWCPPSSTLVQDALNIPYCAEISIHSNCTAIYKALQVACDMIANGRYQNALIVTSQISSGFLRAEYFNQKVMSEEEAVLRWFLSDGAGAAILTSKRPDNASLKVADTYLESVGVGIKPTMYIQIGSEGLNLHDIYEHGWHHLKQDLKIVAKLAPDLGEKGFLMALKKWDLDLSKVKCFFLNIPTKHLMDIAVETARRDLGEPNLPVYTKLSTRGYPGAPAILIALDDYMKEAKLDKGDQLVSFVTESSKWMHAGFVLESC